MTTSETPVPTSEVAERRFEVSSRSVFAIAVPMTLAYATVPLLGITDTAVVGRLGDAAPLAGLAVGAVVFDLVFGTLNFIRASTTGFVAQAFGRGDDIEQQAAAWRGTLIGVAVGIVVALCGPLLAAAGVAGMGIGGATADAARSYVVIRSLGAPFSLANYALLGYVLGRGEARLALILTTLLNGTNIALSITLGLGLGWGVAGVAAATVIGEAVVTAATAWLLWRRFAARPARPSRARVLDRAALSRLFAVNGDIMIRSFCLIGTFALFTRLGADQGPVVLAANALLMNLFLLSAYILDGLATAAEQQAGRALGAGWREGFERSVRLCTLWGLALTLPLFLVFSLGGGAAIDLMTTEPDVRETARRYLVWAAATAPVGVLAFVMDGVFIGATWSRDMRNTMLASVAVFAVVALLARAAFGNHGLWLALNAFLLARGLLLRARMSRNATRSFEGVNYPSNPTGGDRKNGDITIG